MKRKLLCVLSAIILILTLTACGSQSSEASDFDAFMEVQKNMDNVKDMEIKMDMDASVTGEEDFVMSMSGTAKEILNDKENIQMQMDYNMTVPGLDSEMSGVMYMKDNMVYMDLAGQKMKMDASNEMAAAMKIDSSQMLDITEDMISDLTVSKKDGNTVYKFKLDADKALSYFQKNAGSAGDLTESVENISFDKMDVTVVADDKQMAKSIDMDCSITTQEDGDTVSMNYKISMEYLKVNAGLKIDFPDFSQYQEVSV